MSNLFISELLTPEEMRAACAETGGNVELIRFSIAPELDRLEDAVAAARAQLRAFPTPPRLTLHGPYLDLNPATWDSELRGVALRRFGQAYEAALALGAEKLVLHSGFIPNANFLEGWAPRMADFFRAFLAGRGGVQVALENVFDPRWEPLLDVWRRVDRPDFALCLDLGHAHCYAAQPVAAWAEGLLPALSHVHVHDNRGPQPFPAAPDAHLALGDGTLPLADVFAILRRKPGLTFAVECASRADVLKSWRALRAGGLTD